MSSWIWLVIERRGDGMHTDTGTDTDTGKDTDTDPDTDPADRPRTRTGHGYSEDRSIGIGSGQQSARCPPIAQKIKNIFGSETGCLNPIER